MLSTDRNSNGRGISLLSRVRDSGPHGQTAPTCRGAFSSTRGGLRELGTTGTERIAWDGNGVGFFVEERGERREREERGEKVCGGEREAVLFV